MSACRNPEPLEPNQVIRFKVKSREEGFKKGDLGVIVSQLGEYTYIARTMGGIEVWTTTEEFEVYNQLSLFNPDGYKRGNPCEDMI